MLDAVCQLRSARLARAWYISSKCQAPGRQHHLNTSHLTELLKAYGVLLMQNNGNVDILIQSRVAYKKLMLTLGSLLLRDANVSISEAEKQERLQQFADDAYSVEMQLAQV